MTMNCGRVTDTKKTGWEIVSCQMFFLYGCMRWMHI